jgi:3-hydroxybutyryl-CoA dehydrogenase
LRDHVRRLDRALSPEIPILLQTADVTLSEAAAWAQHPERLVGFDGLFLGEGQQVTLVSGPRTSPDTRARVETFAVGLGRSPEWIEDGPALVIPRIVCALANEAFFALGEGTADEPTIDLAMRLGANYPHGPLAWARRIGLARVLQVMDHMRAELGEDRYRAAPLLRRWARSSPGTTVSSPRPT